MNTIRKSDAGERILEVDAEGPPLDANTLIGDAISAGAQTIVLPTSRLAPAFFDLKTRIAGEMIQKFVNYRLRLIVIGDIASQVAASKPLHDFVYETNRGAQLWFVPDRAALDERLAGRRA